MPLDDILTKDGIDTSIYNDMALKAFSADGVQYGVPDSFSNVVLIYNKDLFDQADIDYPTDDWKWEDAMAAAEKIRALGDNIFGYYHPISFNEFYKTVKQNGGSLFNDDFTEFTMDTPENIETLQYMVDMQQKTNVMPTEEQMAGILSTVIGVGYSDPVVQRFEEAFHDYPFCLLNDTACFAYAEYVFANITEPNFAYINVSKGVGACLFANGKMLRGAGSNATQFGHFSVDRNGPLCACGNHGCVERVVGENALTERAEACGIDLTRFAGRKPLYCDIGAMAEDGDVHAKELIKDLAVDLSFAISNLITLFNPSLVVIGGMGVNLGPFFLSNIRDEVQNSGFKEFVSNTWIQYSTLGLDSELGGAARYYIDHYYDFFEQMQGGLYAD